jgi:four helix bundle protein
MSDPQQLPLGGAPSTFRGLRVQQEAALLAKATYDATEGFPAAERRSLGDQMRRAAMSVPANIAEACGRASRADRARVLAIAWGSLRELEAQLELAAAVRLLDPVTLARLSTRCRHTGRLLHALRRASAP